MKELLYTKYKLDYAYFIEEDGERRETDAFAFSRLENLLCQPELLDLPKGERISGMFAYYFDTNTQELKHVRWSYETEADTRGYVEVRLHSLEETLPEQLPYSPQLLEQLVSLLLRIYLYMTEECSGMLMLNLEQLFTNQPDELQMQIFLKLFFLLLPEEQAKNILAVSRSSNYAFTVGAYPSQNSLSADVSQFPDYLLNLLHQCETLPEYRTMLKIIGKEVFRQELKLSGYEEQNPPVSISGKCARMLRFWTKISRQNVTSDIDQHYLETLFTWIIATMELQIQKLSEDTAFPMFLKEYRQLLLLMKQPEHKAVFTYLRENMRFHKLHCNPDASAMLRDEWNALRELQDVLLPEDKTLLMQNCFAHIASAETASELREAVHEITAESVPEFFNTISFSEIDRISAETLCQALVSHALHELKFYRGYGEDEAFVRILSELDTVKLYSEKAGFDFQHFLFENYALHQGNPLLTVKLMDYFISEHMTLAEILSVFSRFAPEDFYLSFNSRIPEILISALQKSDASDKEETEALCQFLKQYQIFRDQYDKFIIIHEKIQDIKNAVDRLYHYCQELLPSHIRACNACASPEAKQILIFINRSILGNPAVALFMMYAYHKKFIGRNKQVKYHYYDQFFELLLRPLLQEEALPPADIRYFIWIFQKKEFHLEKPVIDAGLNKPKETVKNFQTLWFTRLGRRFPMQSDTELQLTAVFRKTRQRYFDLIYASQLDDYENQYVSYLKTYFISMIENL